MAQTRIGFIADYHYPDRYDESVFVDSTSHIYDTLNSDYVVWGGDQMGGGTYPPPHTNETEIREFWEMVKTSAPNGDLSTTYQVAGNHDIPIPFYEEVSRDYIGERAAMPNKFQPVDGVTCLLVNSCGPGGVDGGIAGVGMTARYIPINELKWMVDEIQAAHSRGDIVLLFTHASLWFAQDPIVPSYHPEAPFSDIKLATAIGERTDDGARHHYFMVQNYEQVMEQLTANAPVCIFHGDEYYQGWEGYHEIGTGVYHTHQDHWAHTGDATTPNTTSYIDCDTTTGNVQLVTVEHTDKTENVIMDVTPSW